MFVENDYHNREFRGYAPAFVKRAKMRRNERERARRLADERDAVVAARDAAAISAEVREARINAAVQEAFRQAREDEAEAIVKCLNRLPKWAKAIVIGVCEGRQQSIVDMFVDKRTHDTVLCRDEVFYLIRAEKGTSFPSIGAWFRKDHTSVIAAVARHSGRSGLPNLTSYDLIGATKRNRHSAAEARRAGRSALDRRAG
jgi:hypothetical protein